MEKAKVIVVILFTLCVTSVGAVTHAERDTLIAPIDIIPDNIIFQCLNHEKVLTANVPLVPDKIITDSIITDSIILSMVLAVTANMKLHDAEKTDSIVPRKYIYLTIDDSPLNGCKYIDSIIHATQIKASIFMVGKPMNSCGRFKTGYNKLKNNPYIEIYNHSYSHANHKYFQYYTNPELVMADFERNEADFTIQHKIARLPGRNLWHLGERKRNYMQSGKTSADLLSQNGYKIYGWDVEWQYDYTTCRPKQSIDQLIKEIENMYYKSRTFTPSHVVLLMHDQMFGRVNDYNDLGRLINKLKELGYIFQCLSAYPD
jgi:Predicted xylanase/chitin deacetylase